MTMTRPSDALFTTNHHFPITSKLTVRKTVALPQNKHRARLSIHAVSRTAKEALPNNLNSTTLASGSQVVVRAALKQI